MRLDVRWRNRRPWLINVDLYFIRYQLCNGYWYFGITNGRSRYKFWSGQPH